MTQHIIFAYKLDKKGGGTIIADDSIDAELKSDYLTWVHIDAENDNTGKWLQTAVPYLDPFIIKALIVDETRPRMTEIGNGILLILRGVNLNKNSDPEDMVSIRLWVDEKRIISVRKRNLKAVSDLDSGLRYGVKSAFLSLMRSAS